MQTAENKRSDSFLIAKKHVFSKPSPISARPRTQGSTSRAFSVVSEESATFAIWIQSNVSFCGTRTAHRGLFVFCKARARKEAESLVVMEPIALLATITQLSPSRANGEQKVNRSGKRQSRKINSLKTHHITISNRD